MSDSLSSASLLLPREDGFRLECSFEFPNSGITVLFGASGSGKTTVLRCIAGLERAKGFVKVDGVYWQNDEQKLFLPTKLVKNRRVEKFFADTAKIILKGSIHPVFCQYYVIRRRY